MSVCVHPSNATVAHEEHARHLVDVAGRLALAKSGRHRLDRRDPDARAEKLSQRGAPDTERIEEPALGIGDGTRLGPELPEILRAQLGLTLEEEDRSGEGGIVAPPPAELADFQLAEDSPEMAQEYE